MSCLICGMLRRLIGLRRAENAASVTPASCAVLVERLDSWWSHGFNDQAILERDSDPAGVERAHVLYEADPIAGLTAFIALAEGGSVWGMMQVARIYGGGHGVPVDRPIAEMWYRRAYEGGSDEAMFQLASWALWRGEIELAETLLARGVERRLTPALRLLAHVKFRNVLKGERKRQARRQARLLLERASALGDLAARRDLAAGMAWGRFGFREILRGQRALASVIMELSEDTSNEAAAVQAEAEEVVKPTGLIGVREAFG